MINAVLKHGAKLAFAVAGILFVLLSMYEIQDITKLQLTFSPSIKMGPLAAGIVFIVVSIVWHIAPWLSVPLSVTALFKVNRSEDGFTTTFRHSHIDIVFGQIQSIGNTDLNTLVALPANDLFDDECIEDNRSALGAFVMDRFPTQVHRICQMVKEQVVALDKSDATGTTGHIHYNIGTALYFGQPLGEKFKMAFVATTTVTATEGIRCDAEDVIESVKGIHRLMNIHRIESVIVPLLGSGHGGLRPQISLLCMLIAFAECLSRQDGKHIKRIRVVIYRANSQTPGDISSWEARRILAFARKYC